MAVGNVHVMCDRAEINIVEAQAESQARRHACYYGPAAATSSKRKHEGVDDEHGDDQDEDPQRPESKVRGPAELVAWQWAGRRGDNLVWFQRAHQLIVRMSMGQPMQFSVVHLSAA